jgi:hypothetical protein
VNEAWKAGLPGMIITTNGSVHKGSVIPALLGVYGGFTCVPSRLGQAKDKLHVQHYNICIKTSPRS